MKVLLITLTFLGSLFQLKAQTTGTVMQQSTDQLNYVFNPAVRLSVTTGPGTFNFGTVNNYLNGITKNESVDIRSTVPWIMTMRATSAYFTKSASSNTPMPCTLMKVKSSLSTTYLTLQSTDIVIATGNKGKNSVAGNYFNLNYFANPGFNYDGGDYTLDIICTLTPQ